MVKITLPDGIKKEYKDNITIGEVASNIGNRLGEMALAGKASGVLVDLSFPIKEDISLSVITEDTEEGLEILRHSTAHIMAQAVSKLFPGVKLGIGPTIENGFYYDFGLQHSLSDEDLKKIEEEMAKIIREDIPFKRMEIPWFNHLPNVVSEDVYFYQKAKELGYQTYLDTQCLCDHFGGSIGVGTYVAYQNYLSRMEEIEKNGNKR